MKESDLQAPDGWGDDELSRGLLANRRNTFSVFVHGRERYRALEQIHRRLVQVGGAEVDSPDQWCHAVLIARATGAFIGAAHLALAGQVNEAFVLSRSLLEWSAYSCLFRQSPDHLRTWLNRDSDAEAKKKAKSSITWANARDAIPDDAALRAHVADLYDRSINFGAHPNQAAAFDRLRIEDRDGTPGAVMTVVIAGGERAEWDGALAFVGECGVTALEVFREGCRPAFNKAAVRSDILRGLRDRVSNAAPFNPPGTAIPVLGTNVTNETRANFLKKLRNP